MRPSVSSYLNAGASGVPATQGGAIRKSWADLCRVFAIFGVIVIHAGGAILYQYGKVPLTEWMSSNALESLTRCSVPLFVMLSGALLLKADARPFGILDVARRVKKLLIPLLTWNVAYLCYVSHYTGQPIDWFSMLVTPPMYHLWFVYMVIGLYLLLPVFQALFQLLLQRRDLRLYLLGFWFIVTSVPVFFPIPLLALLQQSSFFGYGGYFLMGGLLASLAPARLSTRAWAWIYLAAVVATFIVTLWSSIRAHSLIQTAYTYFSPNVVVASVAAFILFTRVQIPAALSRPLMWVSEKSFLVFFMHVVILQQVAQSETAGAISQHVPAALSILAVSFATYLVCLGISAAIRLVPGAGSVFG